MLFCCHRYFEHTEKRYLIDTMTRSHQKLEIGICPICNTKRVVYEYFLNGKKQKPINKKGKKAEKLLYELRHQDYLELVDCKEKHGTKNNMFWLYQVNGTIKDFNNTVKGNCKTELVNIKTDYSAPELAGAFY